MYCVGITVGNTDMSPMIDLHKTSHFSLRQARVTSNKTDVRGVVAAQLQLRCVFFRVEGEGTHWQQVAAGFNRRDVVYEAASENEEEGERLRVGAEAANTSHF